MHDIEQDELSKWMRQCFECPLVGQVRTNVLPQLEQWGGPAGLCDKLSTSSNAGVRASEVNPNFAAIYFTFFALSSKAACTTSLDVPESLQQKRHFIMRAC
jgi:hypothetical protein